MSYEHKGSQTKKDIAAGDSRVNNMQPAGKTISSDVGYHNEAHSNETR